MTNTDTSKAANNVEAIWVNKSSKTGFQVMGCGSHFHGENMALYVSMDVLNAAITRAEQAEAALKATLEREAKTHSRLSEIYVKHTGNDLVNVDVALDDALDELSACKELGGCGYWRDRSKVREADLDAALARVKELEAEREEDHKNIKIKVDFIEAMIGQSSDDHFRIKELEGDVWLRVGEVLAGMGHDDVSITAREKIAKAICAATGKEKP
jgi:hypothetical protein